MYAWVALACSGLGKDLVLLREQVVSQESQLSSLRGRKRANRETSLANEVSTAETVDKLPDQLFTF